MYICMHVVDMQTYGARPSPPGASGAAGAQCAAATARLHTAAHHKHNNIYIYIYIYTQNIIKQHA